MKRLIFGLLIISAFFSINTIHAGKGNGHELKFRVTNIKDTTAYLAYYYGNVQLMKDTAEVDSKGNFTFKGSSPLPKGIYLVVLPGKKYFEVIVNEQQFFMETAENDKGSFVENMKVEGSIENKVFYDNLKFMGPYNEQLAEYKDQLDKLDSDSQKAQNIRDKAKEITSKLDDYRNNLFTTYPDLFVTKVFKSTQDIIVPDAPNTLDSVAKRNWQYKYFVTHYFENVDMSDDGIIRTPVYHNKVSYFIEKFTPQIPDSIITSIDRLLAASTNEEVYKYNLEYLLKTYSKSQLMCMDAVTVHLLKNYFLAGKTPWIDATGKDSTRYSSMKDYVKKHEQNLCGMKARNIAMKDTLGNWQMLHDIDAKYTAVIFWSATCGHCKKALPVIYDSTYVPLQKLKGFFRTCMIYVCFF